MKGDKWDKDKGQIIYIIDQYIEEKEEEDKVRLEGARIFLEEQKKKID